MCIRDRGRMRSMVSAARPRSAPGQVKLMSVMPSSEMFWMIMSTLTALPARAENTLAATPVLSGTCLLYTSRCV